MRTGQTALLTMLASLTVTCGRGSPAPSEDPVLTEAAGFVRRFYQWYLPSAGTGAGLQVAIRDSAALFDPALVRAIEADGEAQSKNPNEVVGLDGDPFLDAQDFCERYEVTAARHEETEVLVDIRASCAVEPDSVPRIVARLGRTERGWTFRNFHYPQRRSNLLKDLDELRRARDSTGSSHG